jgi:uncharacterized protein
MQQNKEGYIHLNKLEYGDSYQLFNWIDEDGARAAEIKRNAFLSEIGEDVAWDYNRTKIDCNRLSPGCQCCGTGTWSCLFINNICNASCFFCPSTQNEIGEPSTSSISFSDPKEYIEYIKKFNIKGVSISGGEPLITFDKSLRFIQDVRNAMGEEIYIWLYTNGLLLDREKAIKLKEAGLDEIRFDLSAVGYKTAKIRHAAGIIENITVEIPAIPEDLEMLKNLLPKLKEEGVNFLHLHQLRCTLFNQENLRKKEYTFLHGPKVSILESELAALELISWERKNKIGLPINYCSFIYKNKFQAISARNRCAPFLKNTFEDITQAGFIRSLFVRGTRFQISDLVSSLSSQGFDDDLFKVAHQGETLFFSIGIWPQINIHQLELSVTYFNPIVRSNVSYYHFFQEIKLTDKKKVVLEKVKCFAKQLSKEDFGLFEHILTGSARIGKYSGESNCYDYEWFPEGLQKYH